MSHFCLSRKLVTFCSLFSLLLGGSAWLVPSVSYADTSWLELLKPLVKDVIVPGANAGMKRLIEKKMNLKLNPSNHTDSKFDNMDLMNADNGMSMPEEPTANTLTDEDAIMSMPEEPTYSASSSSGNSSVDTDFAPPPPPIETP